ncbi:MAG: hypothetical protein L0Z62_34815 [Gemmataceae bacterium]|nr:hypothetical protein [Gemmataceae bacterium]
MAYALGTEAWKPIRDAEAVGRAEAAETTAQSVILREVFDNPFRPVALAADWRTPAAIAVARSMYEEHRFDEMPLLGDALEEAGCTDAQILTHCRQPGEHVRGCWVVDLILGRE